MKFITLHIHSLYKPEYSKKDNSEYNHSLLHMNIRILYMLLHIFDIYLPLIRLPNYNCMNVQELSVYNHNRYMWCPYSCLNNYGYNHNLLHMNIHILYILLHIFHIYLMSLHPPRNNCMNVQGLSVYNRNCYTCCPYSLNNYGNNYILLNMNIHILNILLQIFDIYLMSLHSPRYNCTNAQELFVYNHNRYTCYPYSLNNYAYNHSLLHMNIRILYMLLHTFHMYLMSPHLPSCNCTNVQGLSVYNHNRYTCCPREYPKFCVWK